MRLRGVQLLFVSIAIQETDVLASGQPLWGARLDAVYIGKAVQELKNILGGRQERLIDEAGLQRASGSNAMEVDQGDVGGSIATGSKQFKHLLATPNFDERAFHRDQESDAN